MEELKIFFADPTFVAIIILMLGWLLIYAVGRWKNKSNSDSLSGTSTSESDTYPERRKDRTGLLSLLDSHQRKEDEK